MDRIFLPPECFADGRVAITGAERSHLANSLRLRAGERFRATDGLGTEYVLRAERISRGELVAGIVERVVGPPESGRAITLAIAPPRGKRMEIAIEKTVECGVGRLVPLVTTRSVLKSREDSARSERWLRIARSATAQCGRTHLPGIAPAATLEDTLEEAAGGRMILAHPGPDARRVPAVLGGLRPGDPVTIFVGPEGGFTPDEVELARRAGAVEVTLGSTRLRSETAAIVAVSLAVASIRGD